MSKTTKSTRTRTINANPEKTLIEENNLHARLMKDKKIEAIRVQTDAALKIKNKEIEADKVKIEVIKAQSDADQIKFKAQSDADQIKITLASIQLNKLKLKMGMSITDE